MKIKESQLRNIIRESVKKILSEGTSMTEAEAKVNIGDILYKFSEDFEDEIIRFAENMGDRCNDDNILISAIVENYYDPNTNGHSSKITDNRDINDAIEETKNALIDTQLPSEVKKEIFHKIAERIKGLSSEDFQ